MSGSLQRKLESRLDAFLGESLGLWPPGGELVVATSPAAGHPRLGRPHAARLGNGESERCRRLGRAQELLGLAEAAAVRGVSTLFAALGEATGEPGAGLRRGVFRSCRALLDLGEPGSWVPSDDERVPEWLRPFSGEVLVLFDEHGRYAAGVGIKRHSALGQEIAVGTEPIHRGRGLARALVAQAARRIYAAGAIATYLHAPDNAASGKVAEAAGFPDLGWTILSLAGARESAAETPRSF